MSAQPRRDPRPDILLGEVLAVATDPNDGFRSMWRHADGDRLVVARECWNQPEGQGLVDLVIGAPGEHPRDLADRAPTTRGWFDTHGARLGLTIDEACEEAPLHPRSVPLGFDRTLSGPHADRWLNAFDAKTVIEADWTPSAKAGDRAIDVLAHQLTQPGTTSVAWTSDRDPTDPDGPRTPTVVAISRSPVRNPGATHVDLHVRQLTGRGAGFSWFRYGDTDLGTLRSIAPLHPDHVDRHGGTFDRLATRLQTVGDTGDRNIGLAILLEQRLPGRDRHHLADDIQSAIHAAAKAGSRTAARQWFTVSLPPDIRRELARPENTESLTPLVDDAIDVAQTRVRPLNNALRSIREIPAPALERVPTVSR